MSVAASELIRHTGLFHHAFIGWLSRALSVANYLEIGTSTGDSLAAVDCPAIAVDPKFMISRDVIGLKPACHFFQTTSDEFFAKIDPNALLGGPVELAFLDGLHLFEFLLRDFINMERHCAPNSVIILHDCFPPTFEMTTRTIQGQPGNEVGAKGHPDYMGYWTGDVWKAAAILREYRPDLRMICVNSPPTGLLLCTRLDPRSTTLSDRYAEIVEHYAPNTADEDRLRSFLGGVELTSTDEFMNDDDVFARLGHTRGKESATASTAEALLKSLIAQRRPRRIAWIAPQVPEWLLASPWPLLIVSPAAAGARRPDDIWIERYPSALDEPISATILQRLEGRQEELELAYLDGDHSLPALRSQLLFLTDANPRMVIALGCAVPPSLEIAGPRQIEGQWWVGEVWAAIVWLKRAQASLRVVVVDADPVGFAVLADISHKVLQDMDIDAARGDLADLKTLGEVRAALGVAEPARLLNEVRRWPGSGEPPRRLALTPLNAIEADPSVEVKLVASALPFVRPPAEVVADFSRRGFGHELGAPKSVMTPRKVWIGTPDALIRGYFLMELAGGRLFFPRIAGAEGVQAFADHIRNSGEPRRAGRAFHSGLRWLEDGSLFIDDGRLTELDGDVFWATPDEPENWGVWLTQALPALIYAESIGFDGTVLAHAGNSWQLALIKRLAPRLSRKLVNQEFSRTYRPRGMTWTLAQDQRNFVLTDFDRDIYDLIADAAGRGGDGAARFDKVYISRQSWSRRNPFYRVLLNEAELAEALTDDGFQEIEPETLSFDQQVALFARARYIVGAGGAALFNAVFCRAGRSIFTIESSNRWVEAHANLFASRGLHYSVAFGRELERDAPPHKRWTVPVDELMAAIRRADPIGG